MMTLIGKLNLKRIKKTKNNVETDNKIEDYISNGTIVVDKMEDDENSDWEKDFKEGKLKTEVNNDDKDLFVNNDKDNIVNDVDKNKFDDDTDWEAEFKKNKKN